MNKADGLTQPCLNFKPLRDTNANNHIIMVHPTSLILDKNMLGNIGHLFVKCRRQVTNGHEYHLLGVSEYYIMYRHKSQSVL